MSIRMLFLKRYKKITLKKIFELKENYASIVQISDFSKQSADELTSHINILLKRAESGGEFYVNALRCDYNGLINKRNKYLASYALYKQQALNILTKINILEEELESIEVKFQKYT